MKKFFILVLFTINISNISLAENLNFTKIVDLKDPWGSSFINNDELIVTEKSGKIKLINLNLKHLQDSNYNLNFLLRL